MDRTVTNENDSHLHVKFGVFFFFSPLWPSAAPTQTGLFCSFPRQRGKRFPCGQARARPRKTAEPRRWLIFLLRNVIRPKCPPTRGRSNAASFRGRACAPTGGATPSVSPH